VGKQATLKPAVIDMPPSKRRIAPYLAIVLLACLLSVLPAAMFADLIVPVTKWQSWYFPEYHPSKSAQASDMPPGLKKEEAAFRWLVVPPSWLWYRLGGTPAPYAFNYVIPGGTTEIAGMPPLVLALYHFRLAFPFWLFAGGLAYELVRRIPIRPVVGRVA